MTKHFIHYITKKKAADIGIKLYFEGRVCPHGNFYLRRISDKRCTCFECRSVKAEKERIRKANTPEQNQMRIDYSKQYRIKNRKLLNEKKKNYFLIKKQEGSPIYENYNKRMKERNIRAKSESPSLFKAYAATARVKKKYPDAVTSEYGELDIFTLQQLYELKDLRENITGMEWAVDHMIPLARGGLHQWDNIQLIPFKLNLYKKHKLAITKPYEWLIYTF